MEVLHIPLTKGFVTKVDAANWEQELVYTFRNGQQFSATPSKLRWWVQKNRNFYYATGLIGGRTGTLHRLLAQAPSHMHVDHRNCDTLDNTLANLRICTHSQNQANRPAMGGASRFKGVCGLKGSSLWRAQIQKRLADGTIKRVCLGWFATEEEAARAYDAAAFEKYGEFALLNFPKQ